MRTRTIIEHVQFRQMLAYHVYYKNRDDQRELKNTLLDEISASYGSKWIRLASGTRSAIDTLTFMATERGFVYASKEWLSKAGVSTRTIDRAMTFLADRGLIYVAYRRRGAFNLTGKPVFLFRHHPYFTYWSGFLGIDVATDDVAGVAAGNSQTTTLANDTGDNRASTYSLPVNQSKELVKERNNGYYIEYVPDYIPHSFARLYGCYFSLADKKVMEYWRMAKLAAWKYLQEDCDNLTDITAHAFRQLIGQMKLTGKHINNPVSYFYGTCKNLFHRQFIAKLEEKYLEIDGQ